MREGRKNNVLHETGFLLHRDFRSLALGPNLENIGAPHITCRTIHYP